MSMQAAERPVGFDGAHGVALQGHAHGNGERTILFFHGGGQTRHAWAQAVSLIGSRGYTAVTLDLRGHGESARAVDGNYRFDAYAADIAAVGRKVKAETGHKAVAVGASLGGLASLLAEIREPDLFEALVLVDITPDMDPEGVQKIQGFMGENLEEGFATLDEAADAIARYLPHRKRPRSLDGLSKNLRLGRDGRYRWHWDPRFLKGDNNINARAPELMRECDEGIPGLQLPVLLVRGMQSELVGESNARRFCERAPNASWVDVGGAGHMVAGDRNDVFTDEIVRFLETIGWE